MFVISLNVLGLQKSDTLLSFIHQQWMSLVCFHCNIVLLEICIKIPYCAKHQTCFMFAIYSKVLILEKGDTMNYTLETNEPCLLSAPCVRSALNFHMQIWNAGKDRIITLCMNQNAELK